MEDLTTGKLLNREASDAVVAIRVGIMLVDVYV